MTRVNRELRGLQRKTKIRFEIDRICKRLTGSVKTKTGAEIDGFHYLSNFEIYFFNTMYCSRCRTLLGFS